MIPDTIHYGKIDFLPKDESYLLKNININILDQSSLRPWTDMETTPNSKRDCRISTTANLTSKDCTVGKVSLK